MARRLWHAVCGTPSVARREWTFEEWLKVIWLNKCSVGKGSGKQRAWIFGYGTIRGIKSFDTTCPQGEGSQCHGLGNFWGMKRGQIFTNWLVISYIRRWTTPRTHI